MKTFVGDNAKSLSEVNKIIFTAPFICQTWHFIVEAYNIGWVQFCLYSCKSVAGCFCNTSVVLKQTGGIYQWSFAICYLFVLSSLLSGISVKLAHITFLSVHPGLLPLWGQKWCSQCCMLVYIRLYSVWILEVDLWTWSWEPIYTTP